MHRFSVSLQQLHLQQVHRKADLKAMSGKSRHVFSLKLVCWLHAAVVQHRCCFPLTSFSSSICWLQCFFEGGPQSLCISHTCQPSRFSQETPVYHCPLQVSSCPLFLLIHNLFLCSMYKPRNTKSLLFPPGQRCSYTKCRFLVTTWKRERWR